MKERVKFRLQPTRNFPEGAPDRCEYSSDEQHHAACVDYANEWREAYECTGCSASDCPQHRPEAFARGLRTSGARIQVIVDIKPGSGKPRITVSPKELAAAGFKPGQALDIIDAEELRELCQLATGARRPF